MTRIGAIFLPTWAPEALLPLAHAADEAGVDELWVWEDCFKQSGVAAASACLAATARMAIGLGLMPAPLRNVALTAMEIATLERMFPGRFRPGIGHGVQSWMEQAGVRATSPLTLLRELGPVVTALLFAGRAGSALTAEIGNMKSTEQLSSLEMIGVDPLKYIIAPRLWAGFISLPVLAMIMSTATKATT